MEGAVGDPSLFKGGCVDKVEVEDSEKKRRQDEGHIL
jgi:hypothetical protein